MNVVLIETEGYGGDAVVEVNGQRLTVRDALSTLDRPARPGPVPDARFEAVTADPRVTKRVLGENPERIEALEHRWGWRYLGRGRIVSLAPLRIGLGVLDLELDAQPNEHRALGDYVAIEIDRISVTRPSH